MSSYIQNLKEEIFPNKVIQRKDNYYCETKPLLFSGIVIIYV